MRSLLDSSSLPITAWSFDPEGSSVILIARYALAPGFTGSLQRELRDPCLPTKDAPVEGPDMAYRASYDLQWPSGATFRDSSSFIYYMFASEFGCR
jgi:hypothetical protein